MKIIQLTTHFTANEFTCKCGKCNYADPVFVSKKICPELFMGMEEVRLATGVPIIITRGVSCLKHHISIYQKFYGEKWEQKIVWDSAHVPDENGMFSGCDSKPIKPVNYTWLFGNYCFFRFFCVLWYKRRFLDTNRKEDYFIHSDYNKKKGCGRFNEKYYYTDKDPFAALVDKNI